MSKEAKAYHHKWISDEKDLRDRYEVMQDYADKYHKEQLLLHGVVERSEQLMRDAFLKSREDTARVREAKNISNKPKPTVSRVYRKPPPSPKK